MTKKTNTWMVRLSAPAETDFDEIIRWTAIQFGERQARRYIEILSSAIGSLSAGPAATGVRHRHEIAADLYTLHATRRGRKARHFVMFRAVKDGSRFVEVLRILHEAVDLPRHLPGRKSLSSDEQMED